MAIIWACPFGPGCTPAAIDFTFNIADEKPIFNSTIRKVLEQPDGKFLILGDFEYITYHGGRSHPQSHLARLNADMTLDPTFDIGTGFGNTVKDIALQSTGKIVVASSSNIFNGEIVGANLVRLNADGSFDDSFLSNSYGFQGAGKIIIQPDQKILFLNGQYVQRLQDNGAVDNTFNQIQLNGTSDMILLPSGVVILAAGILKKYNSTGMPVPTSQFSAEAFGCFIKSLTLQSDGKILVMGSFYDYLGSETYHRMVRLNANGQYQLL